MQAERYGFARGLRARIAARPQPLPYPSLYDGPHAKIAGLDYSLLIDAGLSGAEMAAVLSYNLDLHLAGNRAPLVFVAHAHLYAYTDGDAEAPEDDNDNPDTPSAAERDERFAGLTRFLEYAREHDHVRIVAARDVVDWVAREAERAAQ